MKHKTDLEMNPIEAKKAIKAAFKSYQKYASQFNKKYMVVVNYKEPSFRKRLYVVDVKTKEIFRAHHVAHGSKSNCKYNKGKACYFSNAMGSRKSSLGAMKTGKVYTWGKRFPTRRKLKLHGLEPGKNNRVFARAIVIHSSNYVRDGYIMINNRTGNSWGCLAVDPAICDSLIDLVKDGAFVYCHY